MKRLLQVLVVLFAFVAVPATAQTFPPLTGRVVASALPAGPVASTVHYGPYSGLGDAHQAVGDALAIGGEFDAADAGRQAGESDQVSRRQALAREPPTVRGQNW